MIELFINDEAIDLSGEEEIAIDYAIAKVGEIDGRGGSVSVQFDLPVTAINRTIFENAGVIVSTSEVPYQRLKARLFVNGIDQRVRFATLESAGDKYVVRLYGLNSEFFSLIAENELHDLDLHELDHFRNKASIISNRANGTGFIYPVIDNHSDSPNSYIDNSTSEIDVRFMYPALYFEDLIERIVANAGYTLVNELLALPNYPPNKMALPYSSVPFERNEDMGRYNGTISQATTGSPPGGYPAYELILFDTIVSDYNYWSTTEASLLFGTPRFVDGIRADLEFSCTVTNTTGGLLYFYMKVETANGIIFTETVPVSAGATIPYSFTLSAQESLKNGSTYPFFEVSISANSGAGGAITADNASLVISNVELVEPQAEIVFSTDITSYLTLSSMLPEWTEGELLKHYLQMFSALVDVNEDTKEVRIYCLNVIAENVNQAIDWSAKLDLSVPPRLRYTFDYAQKNTLTYTDDDTVIKPVGTDAVIEIDDANLDVENELVELDFAATEQVERLNGKFIPQIKMVEAGGEPNEVEQRVLVVGFQNFTLAYTDGVTPTNVTTDIPICNFIDASETLNLPNIGFENALLDYYQLFRGVLEHTKIVNAFFRLNAVDIQQLDFKKPVLVRYFNAWFYVNQVIGYSGNGSSTEVELVKLY